MASYCTNQRLTIIAPIINCQLLHLLVVCFVFCPVDKTNMLMLSNLMNNFTGEEEQSQLFAIPWSWWWTRMRGLALESPKMRTMSLMSVNKNTSFIRYRVFKDTQNKYCSKKTTILADLSQLTYFKVFKKFQKAAGQLWTV